MMSVDRVSELNEFADAIDNCPSDSNPGQEDTDGNGLGDALEMILGTDPLDPDTDGANDGDEIIAGTDPLDPDSTPIPEPASVLLQAAALRTSLGIRRRRVH